MKKTIATRMSAIMLAAVMAVIFSFMSYTTAFAASESEVTPALSVSDSDNKHGRIEIDVTPDQLDDSGRIPIQLRNDDDDEFENCIDQTWYFIGSHQGADRLYGTNVIQFMAKVTDSNGNAVTDEISIKLKDYYGTTLGFTQTANGCWYGHSNIAINSEREYYFTYQNLSSSTRNMRIRMIIEW